MTVLTYFERQKERVRTRHDGETYLMSGGEYVQIRDAKEILDEINALDGLNTAQREFESAKRARRREFARG